LKEQIPRHVVYAAGGGMATLRQGRIVLGRTKADINITPLIDVLLVLIVIFMVIAPITPQGLEAGVPQESSPVEKARTEPLILSLSQDGVIRLNQEVVESASLVPRLQDVLRTRSGRTLFVQADDGVLYNEVAHLIDTARGAGAGRIGLMTRQVKGR
jgi:biopolymer transport protein TolR